MFFIRENEKLYLDSWNYNACRIIMALKRVVEVHDGRVRPQREGLIVNRSVRNMILENESRIERLSAIAKEMTDARAKAIELAKEDIATLSLFDNTPRKAMGTYITFALDDVYYSYAFDDNFLFPFYYQKTPIVNGKKSKDACLMEDEKSWWDDCMLRYTMTDADCVEAANLIFNMLDSASMSDIRRDSKKVWVANTYDDGYHYEKVSQPERFETIDF